MYLDYSKLEFDIYDRPDVPELELRTLSNEIIGTLPRVSNLKFNIKFSEPSEISFDIPKQSDGIPTPFYDDVVGYKLIYTKHYGIYVIMNPSSEADGISDVKQIKGYSLEKTLDAKKFFLEEGTFNFWNPASPTDTVIGRILEIATGWSVGYVSPTLIGRYRTFDGYDDYLLSFIYDSAPEKFRCIFVFDPYKMTINAYDADEERPTLPIYLDFDNLIQTIEVEENTDELVTALRPYGADELDIRSVNPIGTNWIYDLSYFIANGDIPDALAKKWEEWQRSVLNNQTTYKGLVGLRSSATARLLAEQAALTDLQGELADLTNQQSVLIQAIALETTDVGRRTQQAKLDEVNRKIANKNAEIASKQASIDELNEEINGDGPSSYSGQIKAITDALAIDKYFTPEEYEILSHYFIEQDMTENTFVATDVSMDSVGSSYPITNGTFSVSSSAIVDIDLTQTFNKRMYTLTGGTFAISGSLAMSGDIIRGTLERSIDGSYVMSMYTGTITAGETTVASGMITMYGNMSGFSSDIHPVTVQEVTTQEGTRLQFNPTASTLFLTSNVSDYQKYSVQMELFDYAASVLKDVATPTYEFSVDSANFIFSQEFEPFRDNLELGKAVYLRLSDGSVITPIIIEFELDFEKREDFSLVFSNRFKRHDQVNTLKDMIESSYSSSRSFDASKYIYNQTVGQASMVSKFMSDSIDAAKNTILGASGQTVRIDGAGLHIGGDSKYQIRAVDRMIAMTDDNWATAKLAIGLFASPEIGEYWGVNADVIGGKLIVGNNLIIENTNDTGVMQFRVDSTGAWLFNSTFILQSDNPVAANISRSGVQPMANTGGKIILDPRYGIVGGGGNLFTTSGTTVTPSFIDGNGRIVTDSDGMPTNANFFLDIRDGSAYFRGKVCAESGYFRGELRAATGTFSGELRAATGTFSGDISAASGTFKGTIQASRYLDTRGNDMMNNGKFTSDYLDVRGLNVNNRFKVDQNGNVTITGGSISWSAVTGTDEIDRRIENAEDAAYDAADDASTALDNVRKLANGKYSGTFIDGTSIYSPTIYADEFVVMPNSNSSGKRWTGGYSMYGYYDSTLYKMLSINYFMGDAPWVNFESPAGGYARWGFGWTDFDGTVDFSSATVLGISATFG